MTTVGLRRQSYHLHTQHTQQTTLHRQSFAQYDQNTNGFPLRHQYDIVHKLVHFLPRTEPLYRHLFMSIYGIGYLLEKY